VGGLDAGAGLRRCDLRPCAGAASGELERTKIERLGADQVLELGAEAVDSFHPGR
jgi:hypothetical protein